MLTFNGTKNDDEIEIESVVTMALTFDFLFQKRYLKFCSKSFYTFY